MHDLLGASAPTFTTPLEMLRACHGRIQAQCATLHKLLQHLPQHGGDAQARQAAQAVLRYFNTAGQHHHQDEEMDLFPLLLSTPSAEAHELVMQLIAQHHEMDAAWLRLHPQLQALAEGSRSQLDAEVVSHFTTLYDRHIELENGRLLPLAASLLSAASLAELGGKMAARRGITLAA